MPENRVNASLDEADRQAVLAALDTIRQKLPFLINPSKLPCESGSIRPTSEFFSRSLGRRVGSDAHGAATIPSERRGV